MAQRKIIVVVAPTGGSVMKDGHLWAAVNFYNSEDDLTRFLDALQAA